MLPQTILFDLDGTLTDSGEGITKCAQLALRHFGIEIENRSELGCFVGPPLRDSFRRFGVPEDRIEEAITVFRSRYLTVGKYENIPYPGIPELLRALSEGGCQLYVATSKPESTAVDILSHFHLDAFFLRICGAAMDGSRDAKEDVIGYLKGLSGDLSRTVMVGDTCYDVLGAAAFGIPTIAVGWGYGSVSDMLSAGAAAVAHSPGELLELLEGWPGT